MPRQQQRWRQMRQLLSLLTSGITISRQVACQPTAERINAAGTHAVTAGQPDMHGADGLLTTWLRRRNGCARVITERFVIQPDGSARILPAKANTSGDGSLPGAGCCMPSNLAVVAIPWSVCSLAEVVCSCFAGSSRTASAIKPLHPPLVLTVDGMKHELSQAEREVRTSACLLGIKAHASALN